MSTRKFSRSSSVRVPTSNGSAIQIQHCGWLRKQGGKFRTWKRRFFVLRQGSLEYYTDSEQIRLIGALEIGPPDIMEVVACETDVTADDKAFNFIVKKSKTWGSEQKQSLVLSASSADERRDWIRALRKQLYLKLGGGLFGTHLSEVFAYTSPETKYVPRVVYKTAEFIRQYGLTTDGIFRKCGSRHVIEELCDAYDMARPDPILRANEHDAHAAAGVLKQYLRELPEPVIPYRQYDRLKATGYLIEDGQDLKPIIDQLECLPAPNYRLLQFLCQLLSETAARTVRSGRFRMRLRGVTAPKSHISSLCVIIDLWTAYCGCSLMDNSNSQSRGQIRFSHDWRRATTLSRQSTTTDVSPNRRLNGRTTSADRDSSSGELGGNLQVAKRGSSSPADGSGVLAASEASLETAAEQLRHWRSVALVARAEAVCERAKSRALTAELARARCDLNMAETELGLLRKRLSLLESSLAASRSGGFGAVSGVGSTTSVPRDLRYPPPSKRTHARIHGAAHQGVSDDERKLQPLPPPPPPLLLVLLLYRNRVGIK
ncbi:Rho GTPase-activating protein [Echinococcus granulosus]|uniref:Rho GTPase-activating protein n=1 Tax=Echinococcus granulosus TaxID=6210 RepID=W6US42_ECHGR|nr:Rho GTPase-activating protein [Echinococcus granulosus]EUB64078.1 Rho GTPase-activating protein [Echinococcus granulosus]